MHPLRMFPDLEWSQVVFSGHETFVLRASWLKKAYDMIQSDPALFSRADAFVQLGVGKNMAQSIRFWARVCGMLVSDRGANDTQATALGHALLADDGWDPFLVTSSAAWLLHWQLASQVAPLFTFYFAFNLARLPVWTPSAFAEALSAYLHAHDGPQPSAATLSRDIQTLLHTYVPPRRAALTAEGEDFLACPLITLGLIQPEEGTQSYRLPVARHADLPDALLAATMLQWMQTSYRRTAAFADLVAAPGSPGRVFRLEEDALFERLLGIDLVTEGTLSFSDSAGVRQVSLHHPDRSWMELLHHAFLTEVQDD